MSDHSLIFDDCHDFGEPNIAMTADKTQFNIEADFRVVLSQTDKT
jgi:hypothetical protein